MKDRDKGLRPRGDRLEAPTVVISAEALEAARHDPRVIALHEQAEAYVASLVARGHCPCHLVVNCPDRDS